MYKAVAQIQNEKGLAMIETVPLLVIFFVLISFGMGFYGMIHTAILHSIAARTYSFETFRNRTNLTFFREDLSGMSQPLHFKNKQWRYHAISHESDRTLKFVATTRPIAYARDVAQVQDGDVRTTHNNRIFGILPRNERVEVNPAWIMVGYGICLNAKCGGN